MGIALTLVSLMGPWWGVQYTALMHFGAESGTLAYAPFGYTTTTQLSPGVGLNETNASDYRSTPDIGAAFSVGMVLLAVGEVPAIVTVVLAGTSKGQLRRQRWTAALCGIAGAVMMVGLIYVMAALPGAVSRDNPSLVRYVPITGFWGSGSWSLLDFRLTLSWGAGWAWYVALMGALLFLVAAILLRARDASTD